MHNYICYHLHSDMSLLDSCTPFSDYVNLAKEQGMTAIASTEHGLPRSWVEKKQACDAAGIKFIFGVETYLTKSYAEKQRDNYHTILLSANEDGRHELNQLMEFASRPENFYYVPRLDFDTFLRISPNIIKISACLASPLNKLDPSDPYYEQLVKHYDYLEIQHHASDLQADYNKRLLKLSRQYNKPLIAGTDTHSSSAYKAECRSILLERKEQFYPDEQGFALTWLTYDELVEAYEKQGALSRNVYMTAIENTNEMASRCEDFKLDTSKKFPISYGSPEEDEQKLREITHQKLEDKIASGIIPPEQADTFRKDCEEELDAFHQTNMSGFMLSMADIVSWCRDTDKPIGPCRGSVGGSRVAYVTDIIDMNPVEYDCVFSRFCNTSRQDDPDIDIDCIESDRPAIFNYIRNKFGDACCARVASYGTIADLSFVDDCGGGLAIMWEREHNPSHFRDNGRFDRTKYDFDKANPYHPLKLKKVKEEYKSDPDRAKDKHPDIFKYFSGMIGTRISQSVHPAGIVIASQTLPDNWGVFHKDGEKCLLLSMSECHNVHLLKYDCLILKCINVIRDCCNLAGLKYPRMYEINFKDKAVWDDISTDALAIFQFESPFAAESLTKFKPQNIEEITVMNAALRPSGASYRDDIIARKVHKNPTPEIDAILSCSFGRLVYQESTIEFLQKICGLSASYADSVRRAIAKKKRDEIDKAIPEILEGYCANSKKPREEAEQECKEYLQVIEDASAYSFGRNHSTGYSLLSYLCGYYRHYYPCEFVSAYLKNAANDDDIATGKAIARIRGISLSKPKFRQDNRSFYINTEEKIISDSLTSIKGVGMKDAEALYDLRDRKYSTFVELLRDMTLCPGALNTAVIEKLIKLNYFEEFGCIKRLLKLYDAFYNGPHCFKTTLVPASQATRMQQLMAYELGTPDLLGETHSDLDGLVDDPRDIVRYEAELYGEPTSTAPAAKGEYIVLEVDTKYSPRLQLYSVSTGKKGQMKILKKTFEKNPLAAGDWIRILNWNPKEAYGKPGVIENWINAYDKILF